MRTTLITLLIGLTLVPLRTPAQTFSSGSDGSYGAINITADTTLDVPTNGIFNCTTITVAQSRTLTFRRNAANTPVYLLASGNISIVGTIDVSGGTGNGAVGGLAGPGGFDGGSPGSLSVPPGAGYGPGAGNGGAPGNSANGAGSGSFGTVNGSGGSTNIGAVYANALIIPIVGGSGGGGTTGAPGLGGGGGGGGILISSSTRIDLAGAIVSQGSHYVSGATYNGGSGGAIRLVAPVVAGSGRVDVTGLNGGHGRIRVDAIDRSLMNYQFNSPAVTSIGSLMLVFPTPTPRLDIIEAAGTAIPEGSGPVTLLLPFGSSPNRTIKVQARDFAGQVPLTIVLTPDHGAPNLYTSSIDNGAANNPAVVSVDVVLPINEQTTVNVYSK